eukprot:gene35429-43684_t
MRDLNLEVTGNIQGPLTGTALTQWDQIALTRALLRHCYDFKTLVWSDVAEVQAVCNSL